jgi:hypothetical protein
MIMIAPYNNDDNDDDNSLKYRGRSKDSDVHSLLYIAVEQVDLPIVVHKDPKDVRMINARHAADVVGHQPLTQLTSVAMIEQVLATASITQQCQQ